MANREDLRNAKTIGQKNFENWSRNAGLTGNAQDSAYFNVLPQHQTYIAIASGWLDWQKANIGHSQGKYERTNQDGTFYSSWGPEFDEVNIDLSLASHKKITVDGFGEIRVREEFSQSIYDNEFWLYNGQTPGPVIIADPGDTIKVKLTNNLGIDAQTKEWNGTVERTNLHLHGSHVSPQGKSDNVMIAVENGDSQEYEYKIPENHPSGLLWMHPHLHGSTSLSLAGGAALPVFILPDSEDTNNLSGYDPTKENIHLLSLQSWAVEQEINPNIEQGEHNWENTQQMPARVFSDDEGNYYKYSSSPFNGNNYQPLAHFTGNPYWGIKEGKGATYADYVAAETTENLIHTVNGQYNPTIKADTGEWVTFGFLNFSLNSSHIIQLIHVDDNGNISLESPNLLGIDSDISRWASEYDTSVSTLPGISPGGRITIQHSFNKPGDYYFISNASEEVLGDLAPNETNRPKNSSETYLGYNDGFQITPSQVLATVEVTGNTVQSSDQPDAWDYLDGQRTHALGLKEEAATSGVAREREFNWFTDAQKIKNEEGRGTEIGPDGEEYIDPGYNDPESWESVWTINQQYWTHEPDHSPTISIAMLDTLERWSLVNSSKSFKRDTWPKDNPPTQIQVGQAHPFHLHQNEFIVETINGLNVGIDPSTHQVGDAYIGDSLVDVYQMAPAYAKGTVTTENPFGTPMILDEEGNQIDGNGNIYTGDDYLINSKTDILVRFEDFTGLYVDHCHLLFHEDGGMMVPVLTILNTNDSWITNGSRTKNSVDISLGSNRENKIEFQPFESSRSRGVNIASGDINALNFVPGPEARTVHVTDNIEDIAVIEATSSNKGRFKLNIFDGQSTKDFYSEKLNGNDPKLDTLEKIKEMTISAEGKGNRKNLKSSLAVGDINGDGYDDIIVGISGKNYDAKIRVFSGSNYEELYCLTPFGGAKSDGIDLAVGDMNGDNYADIIVSQLEGGQGIIDGFNGKKLTDHSAMGCKDEKLSNMAKLWGQPSYFNPHGNTDNAVRIAIGYSLPDEQPQAPDGETYNFDHEKYNQTYLANLSTMMVDSKSKGKNSELKNWLLNSSEGAHAGHGDNNGHSMMNMGSESEVNSMMSIGDEIINPTKTTNQKGSKVTELIMNGKITLDQRYTDIDFQYFDIDADNRGQGSLLLTQDDGDATLMHLTKDAVYHDVEDNMRQATWHLEADYFGWA
ncbi:multicopper oxidase domain-containing protein [Synechococcus sp. MU1650]|uniref:multicopper oxidase domain-containing protein n=1 Tax=Synechococcus sp. MU1650 TaxID=2508352 RepID=UPI001CF7FA1E|nr:multicopper oxidase domain-containing protein [Synechococcus sp. MU1650]